MIIMLVFIMGGRPAYATAMAALVLMLLFARVAS
jgi:hypothetical protein